MLIKSGNQVTFVIPVVDVTGAIVTSLPAAIAVKFMIKRRITDLDAAALVSKSLGDGITVDAPIIGTVSVVLNAPDTQGITQGTYYMALQIEYSADNIQEINLKEDGFTINQLTIEQDIIDTP